MTERKPAGVPIETWVDRQIREATERGEFDNVPGMGEPIKDLDKPYDAVWATRHLAKEGATVDAVLPPSLRLRKEVAELRENVRDLAREELVREEAEALNERILRHLRMPSGPPVKVGRVDVDRVVAEWRADREAALAESAVPRTAEEPTVPAPRVSWWRRLTGRS